MNAETLKSLEIEVAAEFYHSEKDHWRYTARRRSKRGSVRASDEVSPLDCALPLDDELSAVWEKALEPGVEEYPDVNWLTDMDRFDDAMAARGLSIDGESKEKAQRMRHAAQICLHQQQPERRRILVWMEGEGHAQPYQPILHTLVNGLQALSDAAPGEWTVSTTYLMDITMPECQLELSGLKAGDVFVQIGWMAAQPGTLQEGDFWTKLGAQGVRRVYYNSEPMVLDVTTSEGIAAANANWEPVDGEIPMLPHDVIAYRNDGHGDHTNGTWGQPACFYTSASVDEIWDYSHQNMERCRSHAPNGTQPTLRYVPAGLQPTNSSGPCEHNASAAIFLGSTSERYDSPHRLQMVADLAADADVQLTVIGSAYTYDAQAAVFCEHAIGVNLHRIDACGFRDCCGRQPDVAYAPFESVRASTHLSAGIAFLSERSHPRDEAAFEGLVHFVDGSAAMAEAYRQVTADIAQKGAAEYAESLRSKYAKLFVPHAILERAGIGEMLRGEGRAATEDEADRIRYGNTVAGRRFYP